MQIPPELANHPKFRILRELGRGGMGVVYEAEHAIMGRHVALKVISPTVLNNPEALARFHGEAKAAGQLDHPNIARAYDADQAGGLHFLVMEYVEGLSLAQVLERKGRLPVAHACHYARQAALGLQHSFEAQMVHRDIKPQNLMRTSKGVVKILDFGLARLRSERKRGAGLTQADSFMGTPEFVAPEQATDARQADTRADIYSLGCTLYAFLTGRPPFEEDTVIKLVLAQLEKAPQPLHELCADVPIELSAVVARMLSKDPAQRYQKPIEVAQALLPFIKAGGKLGENAAAVTGKSSARIGTVLGGDTSRSSGLGQKLPNRAPGPAIPPPIIEDIGPQWDSIVDSDETNRVAKQRRPRLGSQPNGGRLFSLKKWHWIGASAGALLLGLLLLLAAGVIRVKTPNGILVIENVPADAEVTVDGEKVMFSRNGQQVTVETTKEGQFLIKVMSNGVELLSSNVLVKLDGKPVRIFIERDKNFAKYETIPSRKTPDSIPKRKPGGVAEVEIVSGVPSKAPGSIPVRKPGEVAEFEISSGVKMRYCWIPAGKATLGSPASEEMRNNNEAEHEFVTTGFWLGKYTVTKGEWSAVMSNAADANLFPAEVSWDESQSFIKELNNSTKIRASFGMGKFCLPQEDEWEYAARGGKGNRQAFYFGNEANGTQANCNGDTPYGTAMTGPFRGRTTPVGSFENIAPHPWSLCDMVGNVFQWCDNVADNDGRFIVRGGCWNNEPFLCRSASRHGRLRGLTGFRVGFRVCFRPVETEIDAEERSKKLIVGRWRSDRQDLFVFHPDGKLVMFNVAGVMLSTGRWEAKKDGTVTTALENGWSGINTIHADGTQTCKLKNPAGEPAGKWTASKEDE